MYRRGKNMIKSELIQKLFEATKIPRKAAELAINTIFDTMTEALSRGEGIEIRGFGSFKVRQYRGREGRNPKTGRIIKVAPKRRPFFKVGKDLKKKVDTP
jgi:integration host factor subunit beta